MIQDQLIHDKDGNVTGIRSTLHDISERKRAEDFRSVVMANMVEGLYALDGEGCLTFMNEAASRMLGWREDELRAVLSLIDQPNGSALCAEVFQGRFGHRIAARRQDVPTSRPN